MSEVLCLQQLEVPELREGEVAGSSASTCCCD
jgi:hypothetical protein